MHALITEGAFHVVADGDPEFERVQWWDRKALNELFRRKVLRALRQAERLRPETEQMLLGWQHSGFSVHATEPALPDNTDRLKHLARYITRAPMRLDAIRPDEGGGMKVRTPPAPQAGKTSMDLDPLELIHRICAQIFAPRQHLVRYHGWYANRARGARKESVRGG